MKAISYKAEVQDDVIHSYSKRIINEIFIPELNICFNEEGFVFESNETRSVGKEEEIEIADYFAYELYNFCLHQNTKNKIISKLFESI